ncbi:hypothetical protein P154DRAFT_190064 [Amniculicola lignicola CBS 123094]|uniref:Uncharacterized protein n=1 Tax=Amniculicola lignicola CBS 123094 TaxID=1392246 RepID=A0A6A5WHI7_9PLEO|nr:hypothetical protein P154DRAFT_190064 [Amniculicola lignicola CBS 123094]
MKLVHVQASELRIGNMGVSYRVCQHGARPGVTHGFQRSLPITNEALQLYTKALYIQLYSGS